MHERDVPAEPDDRLRRIHVVEGGATCVQRRVDRVGIREQGGAHWAISWRLFMDASFSFKEGDQCYDEGWRR